jgi:ribonuclease VapC
MMIDASALCAILLREADAADLTEIIAKAEAPFTSPIAIYETVVALMRVNAWSAEEAESRVRRLLNAASINVCTINEDTSSVAASAFDRFGKGRHPAALNLGDCFAYACAKTNDAPLLYKWDDFVKTDIRGATSVR